MAQIISGMLMTFVKVIKNISFSNLSSVSIHHV